MKPIKVSDLGKDFKGNKLDEDNCFGLVLYKGLLYRVGNRKGYLIELYDLYGTFYRVIDSRYIKITNLKYL